MSLLKLDPQFKPAFDGKRTASELIIKLSSQIKIESAILFGSCVENKNTTNSDIDLLVIIPDNADIKLYNKIVYQPFFSPVSVDWIFKYKSDFNKEKEIGGISMVADKTGIRII